MNSSGISIVSFRITGVSPLLMHNPEGMSSARDDDGTVTKKRKKIDSAEDEARKHAYVNDDGTYYIKSRAFRLAIIDACAGARLGNQAAGTVMRGSIFTTTSTVTLLDPDTAKPLKNYAIDTQRAVVNEAGILRSRPRFDRWACNLDIELVEGKVNDQIVLQMLNAAGHAIGVGDFRVQRGGEYGRFVAELRDNSVTKPPTKRRKAA